MIKITPVLYNGQTGKPEVEENDMNVSCKQASFYIKGSTVFKFAVISKLQEQ